MTPLQPQEITQDLLVGQPVFAANSVQVGCVSDVDGDGTTARIFVDLGGILCLDGRTIMLPAAEMRLWREENGAIMLATALEPHVLELMPEAQPPA